MCCGCAPTLNDDVPGLDGDLDPLGDLEQFLGVAVAQLSVQFLHPQVSHCAVPELAGIAAKTSNFEGVKIARRSDSAVAVEW
jgi:hypothetical protein